MNIQDIIHSNDSILLNKYEINIKIFLLDLIKKNLLDTKKYEDIINFFILRKDKNFCDSLNSIDISNILFNTLNNPNTVNIFNSNQIIISKSLDIFKNITNISYFSMIINLDSEIYSNQDIIKNQLIKLDENNINKSLEILDNTYELVIVGNHKIFTMMYEKINTIFQLNRLEIQNRIDEITVILKVIYKLVLKENLNIDNFDIQEFINMVHIISIIKLKINDILISKNITNIDVLFSDHKDSLKEVLQIFNNNELEINTESINNIKGVINKYDRILEILNITNEPVEYIEKLYNEYQQCLELKKISINSIDKYIINFIKNIKEYIELIDNISDDNFEKNVDSLDDIHLDLLFELNKQIIELFQEIKNDSNIQVYYNRYEECNVNSDEYKYLKYEIDKIENILDDLYFNNFNEICYINLKKNNLIRKINKLTNLQNSLEKDINRLRKQTLNGELGKTKLNIEIDKQTLISKELDNINLINEELKKEIINNNTLFEQYKLLLTQKLNSLKN